MSEIENNIRSVPGIDRSEYIKNLHKEILVIGGAGFWISFM